MAKLIFQQPVLQYLVSHDPSEISKLKTVYYFCKNHETLFLGFFDKQRKFKQHLV